MIHNVTVFCASSKKTAEKYLNVTRALADILIDNKIAVVYGGGAVGLMGCLADRYIERKGTIRGVIPDFMVKIEWAHPHVQDMVIVRDMHERKKLLIENTDAIIALPGGTGTLEELMEVLSLKRLGKFFKPVILVNTNGFYDKLLEFFQKMVQEKFLRQEHLTAFRVINNPDELMKAIESSTDWDEHAIHSASV
jgi:uncharacterized protein (TIGR00730 family)